MAAKFLFLRWSTAFLQSPICARSWRVISLSNRHILVWLKSRRYRIAEIHAHEEHLKAAIWCEAKWYQDHFDGFARLRALLEWLLSLLNRWLWGYGERSAVLIRNLLILAFLVFPLLFIIFIDQLAHESGRAVSLRDTLYFSLHNIIPAGIHSEIVATSSTTLFLAGLESLFGVVAVALFASYIFRWSLHR